MMDQPPAPHPEPAQPAVGEFMHPDATQVQSIVDRDILGNTPRNHPDWSHRRGEPRVFTLLWMIYLMGSTVLMFSSMAMAISISPEITRPAARTMLVVMVVGFSILWPMVRFSQRQPSNAFVRDAIRDAIVVFIPIQAVLWPQTLPVLASWSISVVSAIALMSLAWIIVIAGIIAMGTSSIHRNQGKDTVRVIWMLIIMLVVFAAPLAGFVNLEGVLIDVDRPRVGWLLSPITGVLELTRDRSELGSSARVFLGHWRIIIAVGCVGSALLLIAQALQVARTRYRA